MVVVTGGSSFPSFIIAWKALNVPRAIFSSRNPAETCQGSWYAHLFNNHCVLCSLQQILLREGCKKILVADSLSLLKKMHRTQMKGVLVDGGYGGSVVTFKGLKSFTWFIDPSHMTLHFGSCPKDWVLYLICRV